MIIPATVGAANLQPVVFSAFGPASAYATANPSLSVQINNFGGGNTLTVTLADGTTVTAPFNVNPNAQQIVLTLTASSLSIYVNGSLATTKSLTAAQTTEWDAVALGCPNYAYADGSLGVGVFTAFDLAIYSYQLPLQRILSHYVTGFSGQENVDATTRVAQILSWANLGIPRAGRVLFGNPAVNDAVSQGPAYSLGGASAAAAVNQVALNHNALAAVAPSGALIYWHKWALFNQNPVATFGDNPSASAGEVPYLPAMSWGYDNTYVQNAVQVTQQVGPNNTITVTAADFASQGEYFLRAPLQQTIQTTSALDAFSQANWEVAKYAQPALRVSSVTVDAASNAAKAFPVILSVQQGQAVTAVRRPVGGAEINQQVIVQKITHAIGPASWETTFQLSPYQTEAAVLQLDVPGFNMPGSTVLA